MYELFTEGVNKGMNMLNQAMELLVFIVNPDKGERVIKHASETGVLGGTILLGEGTVRNTFLRKLGLDNAKKEIVLLIAPRSIAKKTIDKISNKKDLNQSNSGIAFRTSIGNVLGITERQVQFGNESINHIEETKESLKGATEDMHQALVAIVNQGEGHEVMQVAEKHGATGGTVIRARGAGSAEVQEVFKIQIEPEKDILLIITEDDKVKEISNGISDYLNIEKKNTGVLFTVALEETRGLYKK